MADYDTFMVYAGVYSNVDTAEADYQAVSELTGWPASVTEIAVVADRHQGVGGRTRGEERLAVQPLGYFVTSA